MRLCALGAMMVMWTALPEHDTRKLEAENDAVIFSGTRRNGGTVMRMAVAIAGGYGIRPADRVPRFVVGAHSNAPATLLALNT